MSESNNNFFSFLAVSEAFSAEELGALCERIISSGVLGRSRHYATLLRYLVKCSIERSSPKELELAINGLGKAEDFDVSSDSAVRVYVHQLRKKLENYYAVNEQHSDVRIVIPKGQYDLVAIKKNLPEAESKAALFGIDAPSILLVFVAVLLIINLLFLIPEGNQQERTIDPRLSSSPVWSSILEDEKPILLVMGDYYIFGELNENGNIARMVREFDVNSRNDLEDLQFAEMGRSENYLDLDLSYIPEGSAFALANVAPVIYGSGKTIDITMMSDLSSADIRNNHIVYIGYLSALEKLSDMTFAGSSLRIGRSYDELFNTKTLEYYTSDAGLPEEGEPFRDFGMVATFPASSDTQVLMIAGMRDAGLMHAAQAVVNTERVQEMERSLDLSTNEESPSFESLFEVFGVDRLNFDANLIYSAGLDSSKIWNPGNPKTFD